MYLYDEPDYECHIDVDDEERGVSARGSLDMRLTAGPPRKNRVGGITFGAFHPIKVIETLQLSNNEWNNSDPARKRPGLCTEMFLRLLEAFPDYEVRMSGPLGCQQAEGQGFITAMRKGNENKGRPPLPYHEHGCFQTGFDSCQCPIGGRARTSK